MLGLTLPTRVIREEYLARMFRGLGDVVHLLEDTSQPQRVRNEQHLDLFDNPIWTSPIERHGGRNWDVLNCTRDILDWKAAGFTKLQDFWDRNKYVWDRTTPTIRNDQPLIENEDASQPKKKLGLAEFVNGNFIGDRHSYREIIPIGNPFHYPFPSLNEGTDWSASGGAALDPVGANIGIAATRFTCLEEGPGEDILWEDFAYGNWVNDGQVVAVPDANARITKA